MPALPNLEVEEGCVSLVPCSCQWGTHLKKLLESHFRDVKVLCTYSTDLASTSSDWRKHS